MGRRDAVQVILEVIAEMRRLDPLLLVTWEPGWETRGNGTSANYEGGIWHHTASLSSVTRPFPTQSLLRVGRTDLPGPLCNFAGPWCTVSAPRIHVMAAHPANHAGASGGRSMGPLPVTNLFNPRVLGLEIDYAGSAPMSLGQLHVARLWGKAVAKVVGGGDINRVRGHAETSKTGKWDPGYANGKTYDLAALRREAASLTPLPEDDMFTDTDRIWLEDILRRIQSIHLKGFGQLGDVAKNPPPPWPQGGNLSWLDERERKTEDRIVERLKKEVPAVSGGAAAIDYDRIIIGLADELDRRARDGRPDTGPVS